MLYIEHLTKTFGEKKAVDDLCKMQYLSQDFSIKK